MLIIFSAVIGRLIGCILLYASVKVSSQMGVM